MDVESALRRYLHNVDVSRWLFSTDPVTTVTPQHLDDCFVYSIGIGNTKLKMPNDMNVEEMLIMTSVCDTFILGVLWGFGQPHLLSQTPIMCNIQPIARRFAIDTSPRDALEFMEFDTFHDGKIIVGFRRFLHTRDSSLPCLVNISLHEASNLKETLGRISMCAHIVEATSCPACHHVGSDCFCHFNNDADERFGGGGAPFAPVRRVMKTWSHLTSMFMSKAQFGVVRYTMTSPVPDVGDVEIANMILPVLNVLHKGNTNYLNSLRRKAVHGMGVNVVVPRADTFISMAAVVQEDYGVITDDPDNHADFVKMHSDFVEASMCVSGVTYGGHGIAPKGCDDYKTGPGGKITQPQVLSNVISHSFVDVMTDADALRKSNAELEQLKQQPPQQLLQQQVSHGQKAPQQLLQQPVAQHHIAQKQLLQQPVAQHHIAQKQLLQERVAPQRLVPQPMAQQQTRRQKNSQQEIAQKKTVSSKNSSVRTNSQSTAGGPESVFSVEDMFSVFPSVLESPDLLVNESNALKGEQTLPFQLQRLKQKGQLDTTVTTTTHGIDHTKMDANITLEFDNNNISGIQESDGRSRLDLDEIDVQGLTGMTAISSDSLPVLTSSLPNLDVDSICETPTSFVLTPRSFRRRHANILNDIKKVITTEKYVPKSNAAEISGTATSSSTSDHNTSIPPATTSVGNSRAIERHGQTQEPNLVHNASIPLTTTATTSYGNSRAIERHGQTQERNFAEFCVTAGIAKESGSDNDGKIPQTTQLVSPNLANFENQLNNYNNNNFTNTPNDRHINADCDINNATTPTVPTKSSAIMPTMEDVGFAAAVAAITIVAKAKREEEGKKNVSRRRRTISKRKFEESTVARAEAGPSTAVATAVGSTSVGEGSSSFPDGIERKHACLKCSSRFKMRGDLLRHVKIIHEGKKMYSCKFCNKKFGHSGHLNRHVQSVHLNQRRFKCEICGFQFYQASHLRSHMNHIHSDERKSFECKLCRSHLKSQNALRNHMVKCSSVQSKHLTDKGNSLTATEFDSGAGMVAPSQSDHHHHLLQQLEAMDPSSPFRLGMQMFPPRAA